MKFDIKSYLLFITSHTFAEKKSISDSLKYISKKYKNKFEGKNILDIGCGSKPYSDLFKKSTYIGIDKKGFSRNSSFPEHNPDYFFDEEYFKTFKLPFENESMDCVFSFQTLEHHRSPELFFKESKRILKPGGVLLISFPFIWPLHEVPNDYFRYTEFAINDYCSKNNLKIIEKIKRGGTLSVIATLASISMFQIKAPLTLKYLLNTFTLLPIQIVGYFVDKNIKDKNTFLGYTYLMQSSD